MGGTILKALAFAVFGLVMWAVMQVFGLGWRSYGLPFFIAWAAFWLGAAWCIDLYDARQKRRDAASFHHRDPE